jgi:hypothetical protein
MFTDILSAVGLTAGAAVLVATLSFMLSGTVQGRLRAAVLLAAAWFAVVVLLGAADALGQDHGTGPPGLGAAVILPVAALCLIMFRTEQTRHTMSAVPLAVLIAVHGVRVLGVIFLLLYAEQRLPAPFAPVAGWGDVLIGIVAVPLAWTVASTGNRARRSVLVWNTLGLLDLIIAIILGPASSPGPLQVFATPPAGVMLTTLPWLLIPAFIVPILALLHIAIFHRLGRKP